MVKLTKICSLLVGLFLGVPTALRAQEEGTSEAMPAVQSSVLAEGEGEGWPKPQPKRTYQDTERGEIDLGLGFSYLRFRSSPFHAKTSARDSVRRARAAQQPNPLCTEPECE